MLESQGYCYLQRFSFTEINFVPAVAIYQRILLCVYSIQVHVHAPGFLRGRSMKDRNIRGIKQDMQERSNAMLL